MNFFRPLLFIAFVLIFSSCGKDTPPSAPSSVYSINDLYATWQMAGVDCFDFTAGTVTARMTVNPFGSLQDPTGQYRKRLIITAVDYQFVDSDAVCTSSQSGELTLTEVAGDQEGLNGILTFGARSVTNSTGGSCSFFVSMSSVPGYLSVFPVWASLGTYSNGGTLADGSPLRFALVGDELGTESGFSVSSRPNDVCFIIWRRQE